MLALKNHGISQLVGLGLAVVILVLGSLAYFGITSIRPEHVTNKVATPIVEIQKEIKQVPKGMVPEEGNKSFIQDIIQPGNERVDALKATVYNHFSKFEAKNVPSLMQDYTRDGTYAEWSGQASGAFGGKYSGYNNLRILFASVIGNTDNIKFEIKSYDAALSEDKAIIRLTLYGEGHGKLIGDFTMDVEATMRYVYQDDKWLIQADRWNFKVFKTEMLAQATVFPIHWRKVGDFNVLDDRIKSLFP